MANVCVSTHLGASPQTSRQQKQPTISAETPLDGGDVVRVEANFLRLPLFAVDNKKMRTMDGIRCSGTFRREGESYAFTFQATRNVRTLYPGPIAHAAHTAILSLATQRGFPIENPIIFSWRELCGRMGNKVSGRTVAQLKAALMAIKGLMIEGRHALYSKPDGKLFDPQADLDRVVNLYDEVEFYGMTRPDGTSVDINAVWLSRWYLQNLNALFCAPLDYDLWRHLHRQSPIASRLYEFLFLKFYGQETLCFNYPTLVKFIPARPERYLSDAKKQLGPPLALLVQEGVLREVMWQKSKGGLPQLQLGRGARLEGRGTGNPADFDVSEEGFTLHEIQDVRLPEQELVEDFYQLWGTPMVRPSARDLETARTLLAQYRSDRLARLLPMAIERMQEKWPEAKSFGAVVRFLPEAAAEDEKGQQRHERRKEDEKRQQWEQQQQQQKQAREEALRALWQSLPPTEQEQIRRAVLQKQPAGLSKHPALLERLCLEQLSLQKNKATANQAVST